MWTNIISWWNKLRGVLGFPEVAEPTPAIVSVAPDAPAETPPVAPEVPLDAGLCIRGFADCNFATILLVAEDGGTTTKTADCDGLFVFEGVQPGTFRVIPSYSGAKFLPSFRLVQVTDRSVWCGFVDPSVFSVLDSRDYFNFPNGSVDVQGTETFTVQTSCNSHLPTDCRVRKPVDCRVNAPQNCRTAPPFI